MPLSRSSTTTTSWNSDCGPFRSVDTATFLGVAALDDVVGIPRRKWRDTMVKDVMRADWPHAEVSWTLRQAVDRMEAGGRRSAPVVDGAAFVGMITTGEILKLDAILDQAEERGLPGQ